MGDSSGDLAMKLPNMTFKAILDSSGVSDPSLLNL